MNQDHLEAFLKDRFLSSKSEFLTYLVGDMPQCICIYNMSPGDAAAAGQGSIL